MLYIDPETAAKERDRNGWRALRREISFYIPRIRNDPSCKTHGSHSLVPYYEAFYLLLDLAIVDLETN